MDKGVEESKRIHFLRKPLFFWAKSFAENEVRREDSFTKFLASDVLNYVLEYIGIPTERSDQSSLHLSAIFDEESTGTGSSLPSSSSRSSKYETESKHRILKLNRIFNLLRSHFEECFNQLLLTPPPNSPHITSACVHCGIAEMERILLLLLGAAVQGYQKQETMRKIREFPSQVQQELIEAIKDITTTPDLLLITPWTEFGRMTEEEQRTIYEALLGHLRKLIYERNEAVQSRLLAEFGCGLTNCEQRRELEARGYEGLDFEKYVEENRSSAAMRDLREELLEKSDLLKECREELEMMKSKLVETQEQLIETEKQLKTFKKSRDEFDILREGTEKGIRLEAEVLRLKKKLEESEQYYEQVEILQNENRTYQRKHAILMDQINMLTVEKERLEVSFMTQSTRRSPYPKLSTSVMSDDDEPRSFSYVPNIQNYPDELLLDSDEEIVIVQDKPSDTGPVPSVTPNPLIVISMPIEAEPVDKSDTVHVTSCPTTPIPKHKDAETQNGSLELLAELTTTPGGKTRNGGPKRGHRRARGGHGKRTKKSSIFPHHPKVILRKVQNLTNSNSEKLDQVGTFPEPAEVSGGKKGHRRGHSKSGGRRQREADIKRQPTPTRPRHHTAAESDADEELSLSPNPNHRESDNSDLEMKRPLNELPFPHFQHTPLQEGIGSEDELFFVSEDELFFVCSTVNPPAMARNVKIYAPSREPHPYQSEFYGQSPLPTPGPPEQLIGSPILNLRGRGHFGGPPGEQGGPSPDEDDGGPPLIVSRCSIEVNLRHGNSNQFSLLEPQHEEYVEQTMLRHQSLHGHSQPIRTQGSNGIPINPGSTTEEDEDSVWYEYGCV